MTTTEFAGILPAVVTPFDENENFQPAAFERLLERLYATAIDGLYVNGQTGEGLLQPVEQRKRVTDVALHCSPKGKKVIVHVGAYRTADALELARHAASSGAHAIASLPPMGAYSFAEIQAYYRALASVSDLPVVVYYFPVVSPAIQAAEQVLELLEIPNVIGLKFTDFDLYKLSRIKQRGCVVFNGHDEVLIAGLLMGADGGIGSFYNLAPELFVEAYCQVREGKWAEAQSTQKQINELIEIGLRVPVIPGIKAVLRWTGIDCGQCLTPRRGLTPDEETSLRNALRASSFAHLAG
jgi:N-acetylneuraminate lyase